MKLKICFSGKNEHRQVVSRRLRRKRAEIRNHNHMNERGTRNFIEMYKNTKQQTNYNDMDRTRVRNYNDMSSHEKCSVWINHDNYAVAELA